MVFKFACSKDIESWMELLELVKDNFPGLDKEAYKEGDIFTSNRSANKCYYI